MFIKYGAENHLSDFCSKGEMYFNPCKYFRDLEEEQKKKGVGDGNDGGLCLQAEKVRAILPSGIGFEGSDVSLSLIVDPALKTPTFCIRRAETASISREYREKLREQFPNHTHALIIEDEAAFLKNIKRSFRGKAFAHDVFYQSIVTIEFVDFLNSGISEIDFCPPKKQSRYYMALRYWPEENHESSIVERRIDDSNFFMTMFRKDTFFTDQNEFRIVLPYTNLTAGRVFKIRPFHATLCRIDELVVDGE